MLARDAFVRTNRCAIAMFVRLFVCLTGTDVHCDHSVHFSVNLSLWLDSPMFWAPWRQNVSTYSQSPFLSSTWKRGEVWTVNYVISQERLKIEVKLLLSANRKSYMPHRLAQQQMTLSDLEWLFHASRAISAVAELLVYIITMRTKVTSLILYSKLNVTELVAVMWLRWHSTKWSFPTSLAKTTPPNLSLAVHCTSPKRL